MQTTKEILHITQTIQAAVKNPTVGGERAAEYLQEALDKQSRVIFEGRVGSTEAGALPLGGGEEEAKGPHDLTRKSSRIPTVSARSQRSSQSRETAINSGYLTEIYCVSSEIEAFFHESSIG